MSTMSTMSRRPMVASRPIISRQGIGGPPHFDDDIGYDPRRGPGGPGGPGGPVDKYMPRSEGRMDDRFYGDRYYGDRHRSFGRHDKHHERSLERGFLPGRGKIPVTVVVEHRSGCTGKGVAEDIRKSVRENFPDVKVRENIRGRLGAFEVYINGVIIYSRINQGGYPYVEEVVDAVERARRDEEIDPLERGSSVCNIL